MQNSKLDLKSKEFRKRILQIVECSRRGHIGSAFSIVEIVRVLYEEVLRLDPGNPLWPDRDRFILSKGHGCLALYVALAQKGFIKEDELNKFCEFDAMLGGHPQYGKIPGIEASTGSLGHGLSIGVGIALNARLDNKPYRTFVLLGDGECDEGTVWEGAMCAAKYKLNQLTVIVDYNKMQCYGLICKVMELEPFADKWRSFGFSVTEVDGHDRGALSNALKNAPKGSDGPQAVICHTTKGKGIVSLEGNASSHHKSKISDQEMKSFFQELESY